MSYSKLGHDSWDPLVLGPVVAVWDAARLVALTEGFVTAWGDISGNSVNLAGSGGVLTLSNPLLGGRPSISFPTAAALLMTATGTTSAETIYSVVRATNGRQQYAYDTATAGWRRAMGVTSNRNLQLTGSSTYANGAIIATPCVIVHEVSATARGFINQSLNISSALGANYPNGMTVGNYFGGSYNWDGDIGFIARCVGIHSDAVRTQNVARLADMFRL